MALPNMDATTPNATSERNGVISRARFRNEVIEQRAKLWLGNTTLALPISFAIYSAAALALTAAIVAFLIFGSFAQTESFGVVIIPEGGAVKVLAPVDGDVTHVYVNAGDRVTGGKPLFRIRHLPKQNASDSADFVETQYMGNTELYSVVKAPVNGRIYALAIRPGDEVRSYQPEPIASIAVADALLMEAAVSSAVQARVKPGTSAQVTLDAFKGRPRGALTAQVISVAAEPTETFDILSGGTKRSYKVVMRINSSALKFPRDELLGKTAQVKFALEKRKLYEWLMDPLQTLFNN